MNGRLLSVGLLAVISAALLVAPQGAAADVGVIIPTNIKNEPDPSILSMRQMAVDIRIDGQYAKVRVLQIFRNRRDSDLEGKYLFTLPEGSQVSDFAIWEDGVRIPGVIVERQRAREIYEELTYMKIDPGLMETSELDKRNIFSVEIFPIPAQGTKRVEIEYTMNLDVTSLRSFFSFPLKPTLYGEQSCAIFNLKLNLVSEFPIAGFKQTASTMPLTYSANGPYRVVGEFSALDFKFTEDFAFEYEIDISESLLTFLTYRNTDEVVDIGPFGGGRILADPDGFFAASVVYNLQGGNGDARPPKDVVLMVDTSLSMQWDKLEKSYEALEFFLKNLPDDDRFALVTFNEEVKTYSDELEFADEANISGALTFFRSSYLMSGTNLAGAVERMLALFGEPSTDRERYVVLITDGAPTAEELNYARIAERIKNANSSGVKFMVFGIGGDTNISLLGKVAQDSGGHFIWASETEDLNFKLATFLDKLGEQVITGIELLFSDAGNFSKVYSAAGGSSYDRAEVTFIGRYSNPGGNEQLRVAGKAGNESVELSGELRLPERDTEHPFLPRRWAKLRVDHLLNEIELAPEGVDTEPMIQEVVALAKRYKFVTPYTSFLAAPRALLRPRAIKPGDPVLRVRTDESIESVVAVFPFGLNKAMHYIEDEDIWETRFLAPKEMNDGTYNCTLMLVDTDGNLYQEKKNFVIDSRPPSVSAVTDKESYRPGDEVVVHVRADRDTRRIMVRIGELLPAAAEYRTALGASEAKIRLPMEMPAGTYSMKITAVDFARNTTVLELPLTVTVQEGR